MLNGIDTSHWQTSFDANQLKAGDVSFVINKCTEGLNYRDDTYAQRKKQCREIGILFGSYHFLDHGKSPSAQADFYLDTAQVDGTELICLDYETGTIAEAEEFIARIHDITGIFPLLYTRASFITEQIGDKPTILSNSPIWIASYRDTPELPPQWKNWALWQHSNGYDGIAPFSFPSVGRSDTNFFEGTLDELKAFWQTITPRPTPVVIPPLTVPRWVKATLLNVRAGPGTNYTVLTQLKQGTQVNINGARITNGYVPYVMPDGREGWLSAMWLVDWSPVPTPPVVPPPTPTHSKLSFHYQAGGDNNALLDILKACHDAGKPIPGMLLMRYGWSGELTPTQVKAVSPTTEVMLRPWQPIEAQPDWTKVDLYTVGRALPEWCKPESGVDFWQTINEPGYGLGTFSYWQGALDEANARGVKLAVGCFATGNPKLPHEDAAWWADFYPILRRCKNEGHAFMLHQYLIPDPGTKDWTNTWGILRHKQLYQDFPADLKDLSLRIGEFGTEFASLNFSATEYMAGLTTADTLMRGDAVRWVALWSVGGAGGWQNSQIGNDKLTAIKTHLLT